MKGAVRASARRLGHSSGKIRRVGGICSGVGEKTQKNVKVWAAAARTHAVPSCCERVSERSGRIPGAIGAAQPGETPR